MPEKLRQEMISALIEKLKKEPDLDLERTTEKVLWEKFKDGSAHFVVINRQIVGCCVVWDNAVKTNQEPMYVELGTIWSQRQNRVSILRELGDNIARIAQGKKILCYCKQLQLARYFRMSPVFPFTAIANWQTCPIEVIESIPQFRGWYSNDVDAQSKYSRLLYFIEEQNQISPWYLVYE